MEILAKKSSKHKKTQDCKKHKRKPQNDENLMFLNASHAHVHLQQTEMVNFHHTKNFERMEQSLFYQEPYTSFNQFLCYNTPHGPVTPSIVNGTTFYHYHRNPIAHIPQNHLMPPPTCACSATIACSSLRGQDDSDAFSSIHRAHSSCVDPVSSNGCPSFTPNSALSSRSSSPFLSSIGSTSARDSGLVSMTDDDTSSIHEPTNIGAREDNLLQLVKEAAEEVMSDKNVCKDSYLFRQMKRNREGFVSIKLLGNSRQIRTITNSHNLLVLALQSSKHLELNKSNTKVKRRQPLPINMDAGKSLTSLLLIDPKDISGIDDITQKLKAYGEMSQIRMVRPGRPIPPYLRGYANTIPQLGKMLCAIVEFEDEASVFKAYKDFSVKQKETGVALLGPRPKVKKSLNFTLMSDSKKDKRDYESAKSTENTLTSPHAKVTVARLNSEGSTDSQDSGISPDELQDLNLGSQNNQ